MAKTKDLCQYCAENGQDQGLTSILCRECQDQGLSQYCAENGQDHGLTSILCSEWPRPRTYINIVQRMAKTKELVNIVQRMAKTKDLCQYCAENGQDQGLTSILCSEWPRPRTYVNIVLRMAKTKDLVNIVQRMAKTMDLRQYCAANGQDQGLTSILCREWPRPRT